MTLLADALKMLDVVVGRPLCFLSGRFGSGHKNQPTAAGPPRRILVIRPGGIGDAVLFLPLLRELKQAWPAAGIDLLMERRNAGVVEGFEGVEQVLRYDRFPGDLLKVCRQGYDLVIDTEQYHYLSALIAGLTRAPRRIGFGTNSRRRMLTEWVPYDRERYEARSFLDLARMATGCEIDWDPNRPFFPLSQELRDFARAALAPLAGHPLLALHPGASIPERIWPRERFTAVAQAAAEAGMGIVLIGSAADRAAAQEIARGLGDRPWLDFSGQVRLQQSAALIASCAAYISADTGPLHLAYAVGTPTVHLFGPGVLAKWGPPGRGFRTVKADVPCSPCTRYGYTPPCCQGLVCMRQITVEQVMEELRTVLAGGASELRAGQGPAA